jgi:hypothetical protein
MTNALKLLLAFVAGAGLSMTGLVGSAPSLRRSLLGAIPDLDPMERNLADVMQEIESLKATTASLAKQVEACTCHLDADEQADEPGERRRTQRAAGEVAGEYARIITRAVRTRDCPRSDGRFGPAECRDPAFAACNREACRRINRLNAGHRRAQAATGEHRCGADTLRVRTDAVNAACCTEDACPNGHPDTCSADCAAVFLPWWRDCEVTLGKDGRMFEPVVELCEATDSSGASYAMQLGVECAADQSVSDGDCVPECNAGIHGYILLLSIDGDDVKYTCQVTDLFIHLLVFSGCAHRYTVLTSRDLLFLVAAPRALLVDWWIKRRRFPWD